MTTGDGNDARRAFTPLLDSSVAIAAERRRDTVQAFLQRVIDTVGDQEAALSPVGVVELVLIAALLHSMPRRVSCRWRS